jgi:hypothetical protein
MRKGGKTAPAWAKSYCSMSTQIGASSELLIEEFEGSEDNFLEARSEAEHTRSTVIYVNLNNLACESVCCVCSASLRAFKENYPPSPQTPQVATLMWPQF